MLSELLLFSGKLAHLCPYILFNLMQLNLRNTAPPPFSTKCQAIRWREEGISTVIVLKNSLSREIDKTKQNETKSYVNFVIYIWFHFPNIVDYSLPTQPHWSYAETITPSAHTKTVFGIWS